MNYRVVTPPTTQCVSSSEAVAHLNLIGSADADVLLKLAGAIRVIERKCGPLAEQTIEVRYEAMPASYRLILPAYFAKQISSVKEDGDLVDSGDYELERTDGGSVLKLNRGLATPILVQAVVGWPAVSVPSDLKSAVLIMLGHLHEVRQLATVRAGGSPEVWPMSVDSLCSLYKSWMELAYLQQ